MDPDRCLDVQGAWKQYAASPVLLDVSFSVSTGEVHGLVGRNGAGKSTLVGCITGLVSLDKGLVTFEGERLPNGSPDVALRRGIALVPQRLTILPDLTVAENLMVGRLPTSRTGNVNWRMVWVRAAEMLEAVGLTLDPRTPMSDLGIASRQMVAIAQAVSRRARLIILDEPTAPLARPEIERLFDLVRRLQESGVSFVYISHHLEEVFDITERVTVLRDGRVRGVFNTHDISPDHLVAQMGAVAAFSRTDAHRERERQKLSVEVSERDRTSVVLDVQRLTDGRSFADISLTLWPGEVVGLTGLEGCGKHDLVQTIFGLRRASGGSVAINGTVIDPSNPRGSIDAGMAYLPQDRRNAGIFEDFSIADNVTITVLDRLKTRFGFLSPLRQWRAAGKAIKDFSIASRGPRQIVGTLSGGNQQKVALAKVLQRNPSVLLLEEPTQGVDVGAKAEILRIVESACSGGAGVILVSDEIETLLSNTDRVVVLRRGTPVALLTTAGLEGQTLLAAIEGME